MIVRKPTPLQQRVLDVIRRHIEERGCPPTFAEIGRAAGITYQDGVTSRLRVLESMGAIQRIPRLHRGIALVPDWKPIVRYSAAERAVMALLGRRRTIAELAEKSGFTDRQVYRVLKMLAAEGRLEKTIDGDVVTTYGDRCCDGMHPEYQMVARAATIPRKKKRRPRRGWNEKRLPASALVACSVCGAEVTRAKASQHAWEQHRRALDLDGVDEEFRPVRRAG